MRSRWASSANPARVGWLNLIEQIRATSNANDGHSCVNGTDDMTQYDKFTGRINGKPHHNSHTDTPKKIFWPRCAKTPTTGDLALQIRYRSSCEIWSSLHHNAGLGETTQSRRLTKTLASRYKGNLKSLRIFSWNSRALRLAARKSPCPLDWHLAEIGSTPSPQARNCRGVEKISWVRITLRALEGWSHQHPSCWLKIPLWIHVHNPAQLVEPWGSYRAVDQVHHLSSSCPQSPTPVNQESRASGVDTAMNQESPWTDGRSGTAHVLTEKYPSNGISVYQHHRLDQKWKSAPVHHFTRVGLLQLEGLLAQERSSPRTLNWFVTIWICGRIDTFGTWHSWRSLTQLLQSFIQLCQHKKYIVHIKPRCSNLDTERYLLLI